MNSFAYRLLFALIILSSFASHATPKDCVDAYKGLTHDELVNNLKNIIKKDAAEESSVVILNNDKALNSERLGSIGQEILKGLNERMIGHHDVKYALAQAVQRAETGTNNTTKPVSSMMLLGLTGTGKSLTAEALHATLGLKPKDLIVIDCGEMQKEIDIAKLTGSPAGYIGHGETPPMISSEKLRVATSDKYNVNVVLIDEIEKSSPALKKILLGVLDKGRLSTGTNESLDFTNSIVIMTSNLGQAEMQNVLATQDSSFGFASYKQEVKDIDKQLDQAVQKAVKKNLSPEFRNRIDKTFVFKEHTLDEAQKILNMNLAKVQRDTFFKQSAVRVLYNLEPEARAYMMTHGYQNEFGGRSIKRAIEHLVVEPLTNLIGSHVLKPGDMVSVRVTNGKLSFHKTAENLSFDQMSEMFTSIYGESASITKSTQKITSSKKEVADKIKLSNKKTNEPDPLHGLDYKHRKALEQIDKLNDYAARFKKITGIIENTPNKRFNDIYMMELIERTPNSNKHKISSEAMIEDLANAGHGEFETLYIPTKVYLIWRSLKKLEWVSEVHWQRLTDFQQTINEVLGSSLSRKDHPKETISAIKRYINDLYLDVAGLPTRK